MASDHLYPHPSRPSRNEAEAEAGGAESAPGPVFSLLADPATIASGLTPEAPLAPSSSDEAPVSSESKGEDEPTVHQTVSLASLPSSEEVPDAEAAASLSPLIDAASARRMAADARARERASRKALSDAQREFAAVIAQDEFPDAAVEQSVAPSHNDDANPTESGWTQHPLVARAGTKTVQEARHAPATVKAPGAPPRRLPSTDRDHSQPDNQTHPLIAGLEDDLRELRLELRRANADRNELEATLAMARQSSHQQRAQIAMLREQQTEQQTEPHAPEQGPDAKPPAVNAASANTTPPPAAVQVDVKTAKTETRAEIETARITKRLDQVEYDLEERTTEKLALEILLEERNALVQERGGQLDALRDRLDAQDRALNGARREYEAERTRHTQSLEILGRLRETLGGTSFTESPSPPEARVPVDEVRLDKSAGPPNTEIKEGRNPDEPALAPGALIAAVLADDADATPAARERSPAPATPAANRSARPSEAVANSATALPQEPKGQIFGAWVDDQVRRHFGPLGVDRLSDLLIAPLERRGFRETDVRPILLIGFDAVRASEQIAENLLEAGAPPFLLHAADTRPVHNRRDARRPSDAPIYEFLSTETAPADPTELESLIERLKPSVIVFRDFLSREPENAGIEGWLAVLKTATEQGHAVVLSESTGRSVPELPEEMRAIGERIWDRLPERYTQLESASSSLASWREAFDARFAQPANGLCDKLRERQVFELFAQFGFLAESFVRSPIEANFDVEAARDRRFLAQVADLDDRKIEAGLAPALHFIGRIDALAEA